MSGTWVSSVPRSAAIAATPFTGGEYYSTSAIFKTNCQEKFSEYFLNINYVNEPRITDGTSIRRVLSDGSIYLARAGFAYVEDTSQSGYIRLVPKYNETFNPDIHFLYVKNIQIEKKPFATSYVDGSRPAGQLNIDKNEIGFFGTPNHVFNFWIKNRWLKEQEFFESSYFTGFVIAEFQHGGTNGAIDGRYDSVIYINKNSRAVYFKTANGSTIARYTIFNQEDYADGEWIMLTVIFDPEGTSSCYVNGELKATGPIAYPLKNRIPDVKFFCNSYPSAKMYSSLISNIYTGKYRKPDGTVIWTDDYIREVYEAKIPFPVQSQLAIY